MYKNKFRIVTIIILYLICVGVAEKIRFLSAEHPRVTYSNPKYLSYVNITSRRYSRDDPRHYVNIHFYSIGPFHNNLTVDFYFAEYLSYDRYKRGFTMMHFQICDLIHKDLFFGHALRQGKLLQPCPFPSGDYHLYNMSVPTEQIPLDFPITKGRIICNMTSRYSHETVVSGYIDMEIKTATLRKKKN